MKHHGQWIWLPMAAISVSAYATTYFSVEQAQQLIFPGLRLTPTTLRLNDDQVKEIEQRAETLVRHRDLRAWRTPDGGWFLVDEVIGKHEFISYALGLNADGSVHQVEILDYRESYGYEVRNPAWRQQFVGKTPAAALRVNDDIRNISGATLSCRHLTEGIKRMLATYAIALK